MIIVRIVYYILKCALKFQLGYFLKLHRISVFLKWNFFTHSVKHFYFIDYSLILLFLNEMLLFSLPLTLWRPINITTYTVYPSQFHLLSSIRRMELNQLMSHSHLLIWREFLVCVQKTGTCPVSKQGIRT